MFMKMNVIEEYKFYQHIDTIHYFGIPLLKVEKPHTSGMEDYNEEEIIKLIEKEFKFAMVKARECLSNDMTYFVRTQKFFSNIAVHMKKIITTEVPIAAVNIINTLSHLYINPVTYPRMKKRERIAVLIHEVLHLALFHVMRYLELPEEGRHHYMWNLATDCSINQMIANTPEIGLPQGCILPETFKQYGINMPPNLSAEEYYMILKNNQDKLPEDMDGGMDGSGSGQGDGQENEDSSGNGNGQPQQGGESKEGKEQNGSGAGKKVKRDWHAKWGESQGNKKMNEAAIKKQVREAYVRAAGKVPGSAKSHIDKILESKIDWRPIFRQYYAKFIQGWKVSTFKRESRRLGSLAKGRRKLKKLSVVVCIDSSASVTDDELAAFAAEIAKMYKLHRDSIKITVIECDYDIQNVYEYKGRIKEVKGRGGTSFIPPFKLMEEKKMEVDLVVYLTDGEGEAPVKSKVPTIWVLLPGKKRPYDASHQPVKWGKSIEMTA